MHAGVVGLLAAALIHARRSAIDGPGSAVGATAALMLLLTGCVPTRALSGLCAAVGGFLGVG